MFTQQRRIPLALVLCAGLGVASCGGASHSSSQSAASAHDSATAATQAATTSATPPPSRLSPQAIVAHVAGRPLRFGEVERVMALASAGEGPLDPPSYAKCVAALKAAAAAKAETTQQSEAELKGSCRQRYERMFQPAVSKAIHTRWLLGEATELGLHPNSEAVQRELAQSRKSFKGNREFEAYLKSSGQSLAELIGELRLNNLADQIFRLIASKERAASSADVAAYYDSHRKQFSTPPGRDLHIFRTTSEASAVRAKSEIQQGKSFAEVAKHLSEIGQPIGANAGEVKDLLPGTYGEKSLNDAIFNAKPHKLYGPLELTATHKTIAPETNSGFFVFEVLKTVPGRRTPLAKVKASIAQALSDADAKRTLAGFIADFRRKWTARTDCLPGFVVRNCRQYSGPDVGGSDPYTL